MPVSSAEGRPPAATVPSICTVTTASPFPPSPSLWADRSGPLRRIPRPASIGGRERGVRALASRRNQPLALAASVHIGGPRTTVSSPAIGSSSLALGFQHHPARRGGEPPVEAPWDATLEDRLVRREALGSGNAPPAPSDGRPPLSDPPTAPPTPPTPPQGERRAHSTDPFRGERSATFHATDPRRKGRDQRRAWRTPVSPS